MLHSLLDALDGARSQQLVDIIRDIDEENFGIIDWLVLERIASIEQDVFVAGRENSKAAIEISRSFYDFRIERAMEFVQSLGSAQVDAYLATGQPIAAALARALWKIWDRPMALSSDLAERIRSRNDVDPQLKPVSAAILMASKATKAAGNAMLDVLPTLLPLLTDLGPDIVRKPEQLLRAVGAAIAFLPDLEEQITVEWQRGEVTLEAAISLLESALSFFPITEGVVTGIPIPTLSEGTASRFKGLVEVLLGGGKADMLSTLLGRLSLPLIPTPLPEPTTTSPLIGASLRPLVQSERSRPPTTPLSRPLSGLSGGLQTAPPSARKSSPIASLAKNYARNDFRELRALPQARLNTSRPPSRHVDDFETLPEGAVPSAVPAAIPTLGTGQPPIPPAAVPSGIMPFYTQ